jgi:spermidine synthase
MKKKQQAKQPDATVSSALRRYLYCTAAITGGAIMIIEILGAKMLAPYVGTSHFVWTAQIAVTLIALAAGYYAGGRMVDSVLDLAGLFGCIAVASVYMCASTLVVRPVAYACLGLNLALGSLLASSILFFIPIALLSTTAPFLSRVITTSLSQIGGTVGRLTSIGTLGSFIGTVLIGYVLIPFLPNSYILLLTAGLLLLVSAGFFFVWNKKIKNTPLVMLAVIAALVCSLTAIKYERARSNGSMVEIFRHNSNFGLLQVFDDPGGTRRFFMNDYLMQNTYDRDLHKSVSPFTFMLHDIARSYTKRIGSVLCIGMGIGVVPMEFVNEGAAVDVVEINPAVVAMAKRYFECRPDRFNLIPGDGRYFINRTENRYDAVVLDAFLGDAPPSHLMTAEAFAGMKRLLNPGGVLVINSFGNLEKGKDFFIASIDSTLKSVFPAVHVFGESKGVNNYYFLASDQRELPLINQPDTSAIPQMIRHRVAAAFASALHPVPGSGIVLTDNYNPVDYFDAVNREALRKKMAEFARDL